MLKPEDRRVKMTKKLLKNALIEIMRTKPIHDISIKKICETADVNRSTFYHHYQTPFDLYDDIISDISEDINVILEKHRASNSSLTVIIAEMLAYADRKREIFLVILSNKGNISIGEKLTTIVSKFICVRNNSELSMYCTQFISAGLLNILWLWLNKENKLPPEEVAELVTSIMMQGVKNAVLFKI